MGMINFQDPDDRLQQKLIARTKQLSTPLVCKPTEQPERLAPLENIRGIMFDVYGTLFISAAGDISIASNITNQQACTEALQSAGFSGELKKAGAIGSEGLLAEIKHTHAMKRQQGIAYPEVDIREEWHKVLCKLLDLELNYSTPQKLDRILRCKIGWLCSRKKEKKYGESSKKLFGSI